MPASMSMDDWRPNWATHPGQHLEEYLETRSMSQAELARLAGLTPKLVSEIVNRKNPVTPDTAIALERVLGLKAHVWTSLQANWDLFQARRRSQIEASKQKSWVSRFPIRDMKAQGLLPNAQSEGDLLEALLQLFGIGETTSYANKFDALAVQHRKAQSYESLPDHVFSWLMLGESRARLLGLPHFSEGKFLSAVRDIRNFTVEEPEVFEPQMKRLCAEAGVAVILMRPLGKTRLFGSAWWIDGDQHAIIQMSLRMKSNDHFWWTFFHECGHIALHRGMNFADDQNAVGDGHEAEADRWAESILYGQNGVANILANPPRTEFGIRSLADKLKIHPGIVLGMLQHYGKVPHNTFMNRTLKVKFEWKD